MFNQERVHILGNCMCVSHRMLLSNNNLYLQLVYDFSFERQNLHISIHVVF